VQMSDIVLGRFACRAGDPESSHDATGCRRRQYVSLPSSTLWAHRVVERYVTEEEFRQVLAEAHCAPCHGLRGEGGRGPNLARGRFYHGSSDADLLRNITEGIPGTVMPGIFYMEDRVWQVVAYIRSLSAGIEVPIGDTARDAALFRSKGCVGCHCVSGQGGKLGPDLTQIGRMLSRPPSQVDGRAPRRRRAAQVLQTPRAEKSRDLS
jgi:mono/diheme cytochrome c family protein